MPAKTSKKSINQTKRKIKKFALGKVRLFILWLISKYGPIHGYGIITILRKDNLLMSKPSRVYPLLKKLTLDHRLTVQKIKQGNRVSKVYSISAEGKKEIVKGKNNIPKLIKEFSKEVFCS